MRSIIKGVFILFLILPLVAVNSYSFHLNRLETDYKSAEPCNETWMSSDESDIPGEGSNPTMEYYPRKYYAAANYDYTLTVKVLARDPDGIDSVIMHYANRGSSDWNQTPMTRSESSGDMFTAMLEFFYNSTGWQLYDTYRQVYYVANDTLGNVAQSPIMEFGMAQITGTADYDGDLYDTPDLWYLVGTTGHEVTWATVYGGFYYTLLKDGLILEKYIWHEEITINVDGLPLGDHVYQLSVDGGFSKGIDNVTVHVVNDLPAGVPTGSVGPNRNPILNPEDGLILPLVASVSLIAVAVLLIVVYRKRQSQQEIHHFKGT